MMAIAGVELETLVSEPDALTTRPPPSNNDLKQPTRNLVSGLDCKNLQVRKKEG